MALILVCGGLVMCPVFVFANSTTTLPQRGERCLDAMQPPNDKCPLKSVKCEDSSKISTQN